MERILYAADIAALRDPAIFEKAYARIGPERREKTDHFRQAEDRQRSVAAELLRGYALRKAGLAPEAFRLRYNEFGKPLLTDCPVQWNLSHSGAWVICAVSEGDVGCDVQKITPLNLNIARRLHPNEYQAILSLPSENAQLALFYRFWALKESFMKACGRGFSLPLDDFELRLDRKISVKQSVDFQSYHFYEFSEFPGYSCAVCAAGTDKAFRLHQLSVEQII